MPHPQGSCRRKLQHPPVNSPGDAQERIHTQGWGKKQTPICRLERSLSRTSPCRNMIYGAIALIGTVGSALEGAGQANPAGNPPSACLSAAPARIGPTSERQDHGRHRPSAKRVPLSAVFLLRSRTSIPWPLLVRVQSRSYGQ